MAPDIPSSKTSRFASFLLAIAAFFCTIDAVAEPDALAFGEIRGYFEPCGCDPKTDLGGMVRLSGLINREFRSKPDLMLLGLGNYLTLDPIDPIKDQHIEMSLAEFPLSAVLYGSREIARERNHSGHAEVLGRIPFVLSNVSSKLAGVGTEIVAKDWLVYGFVSPDSTKAAKNLLSAAKFIKKFKQARTSKNRILLFSGSRKELNLISRSKLFETIISGKLADDEAKESPLGQLPDQEFLKIVAGVNVLFVPYGGQGVLRIGEMVSSEAKSVSDMLEKFECKTNLFDKECRSTSSTSFKKKRVSWLSRDFVSSSTINQIVESFTKARASEFEEKRKSRLDRLKDTPYIGASACKNCHPSSHQAWEKSKHASAFAILVGAGKHRDGECVSCHSVGYESGNGFVDESITPQFSNVQCENCHGPRKEHSANPTIKGPPAKLDACSSCHFGQHSPDFDRESFWRKIQHGPG